MRNFLYLQKHLWVLTHIFEKNVHWLDESALVQVVDITSDEDPEWPCEVNKHQCQTKKHRGERAALCICQYTLLLQVSGNSQVEELKNVLAMVNDACSCLEQIVETIGSKTGQLARLLLRGAVGHPICMASVLFVRAWTQCIAGHSHKSANCWFTSSSIEMLECWNVLPSEAAIQSVFFCDAQQCLLSTSWNSQQKMGVAVQKFNLHLLLKCRRNVLLK